MKKIISLLLTLVMVFSAIAMTACEVYETDAPAERVSWKFKDGVLTFSGSGPMDSYEFPSNVPWYDSADKIKTIHIEDGVTSIGSYAFYECTFLTGVTIPDSVTVIEDGAFSKCYPLSSITIPDGVTSIGAHSFVWCESLKSITIPSSVTSIGDEAFRWCDSLETVYIENEEGAISIGKNAFAGNTSVVYLGK